MLKPLRKPPVSVRLNCLMLRAGPTALLSLAGDSSSVLAASSGSTLTFFRTP